jgi:hypothetical protein
MAEKYKAGSYEHGVDFAASKPGQLIGSIRNYLMKYLAKGFTSTGSKFGEGNTWGAGELVLMRWSGKMAGGCLARRVTSVKS